MSVESRIFEQRFQEQLNELKRLVDTLTGPQTEEIEDILMRNYSKLFRDAFDIDVPAIARRVINDVTSLSQLQEAQVVMSDLFLLSTTQFPDRVIANDPNKATWYNGILPPRSSKVLIYRYGLSTGIPKSARELAIDMNMSNSGVEDIRRGGLSCLLQDINRDRIVPWIVEVEEVKHLFG